MFNIFENFSQKEESFINAGSVQNDESSEEKLKEKKELRDGLIDDCDLLESSTLTDEDRDKSSKIRKVIADLDEEMGQLSKDLDIPFEAKYPGGVDYTAVPVPTEEEVASMEKKVVQNDPDAIEYVPDSSFKNAPIVKGPYKQRTPSDGSIL